MEQGERKSEQKEEVVASWLDPKVLVVPTIVILLSTSMLSTQGGFWQAWGYRGEGWDGTNWSVMQQGGAFLLFSMGMSMLVALLAKLVNKVSGKDVYARGHVALMITMVSIVALMIGADNSNIWLYFFTRGPNTWLYLGMDDPMWWDSYPDFLWPHDAAVYEHMQANAYTWNIPWGAWLPSISWFSIWVSSIFLTSLFITMLLHRVYLDDQFLSFPIADINETMVDITQSKPKTNMKLFWIAFIVSAVYYVITHYYVNLTTVMTGEYASWAYGSQNNGYLWNTDIFLYPIFSLDSANTVFPWVPMRMNFSPYDIAWGLILSTRVLSGFTAGWFIMWFILPIALTGVGIFPEYSNPRNKVWLPSERQIETTTMAPGLRFGLFYGMMAALAIYPLIRHRRTVASVIRSLWTPSSENRSTDAGPLPPRYAWIGLLASVVLFLATSAAAGLPMLEFTLMFAIIEFALLGTLQLMSETGGWWGFFYLSSNHRHYRVGTFLANIIRGSTGLVDAPVSTSTLTYLVFAGTHERGMLASNNAKGIGGWFTLSSLRLGDRTQVHRKQIFRAVLYAGILTIFMASVWYVAMLTYSPLVKGVQFAAQGQPYSATDAQKNIEYIQTQELWHAGSFLQEPQWMTSGVVGGFVSIAAVYLLQGYFTWFPLSPAGFALGSLTGYMNWPAMILALILKYLTLRVGGARLYEDKVKPIAMGFLMGFFVAYFIWYCPFQWLCIWGRQAADYAAITG